MTASGSISPRNAGKAGPALAARQAASKAAAAGTKPAVPPRAPPPFGVADVRAVIPAHCFERSALKSFTHLAKDLAVVAALFYAATLIGHPSVPLWARFLLWPVYWYAQGAVGTGVWVMAHECGHQAFSSSGLLNNTVGWVLHSFLLVPYHSWRISHANHHKNTCSIENDEVFVPGTWSAVKESLTDSPLANGLQIFVMLAFGWPGYLAANMSGPAKYADKDKSHFSPTAALFSVKQRGLVVLSDIGFFGMLALLAYAATVFGVANVLFFYGVPYLVVNMHLVLITYLQHTDTYIPHYREEEFTWLRGALSTVDRSFGWLLDSTFHHITDTHVVHHLFHTMPFYHAQEATEAVRPLLGAYHLTDTTPIPQALWRAWNACKYVEDEGGVVFYKGTAAQAGPKSGKKA